MPPEPAYARNAALLRPVDTCHTLQTPDGLQLSLHSAGPVPRALAYSLDLGLRSALSLGVALVCSRLGSLSIGIGAVLLIALNWGYMVLFEVLHQGRTPGKRFMGLCVIQDDGTPVGWSASMMRNLLRAVDMLPLGYCLGLLCSVLHPQFKRLGDLAAGTLVIYRTSPSPSPMLPKAAPSPAPWRLSVGEQWAILNLAERHEQLPLHRRRELAAILAMPLGVPGEQALEQVHSIARGLREEP